MIVLLTGATGFLGSHILSMLLSEDYNVVILKRLKSDTWRIKEDITKCTVYDFDYDKLESIFAQHHFDLVIHCATSYGRSQDNFSDIVNTNILFPLSLLENCNKYNVRFFLNSDSFFCEKMTFDKFSSKRRYLQYYTLSKRQLTEWGFLLSKNSNVAFINIKLQHIYGEKDSQSKFIPFLIKKCLQNKDPIDLTNGNFKRDFVYITDVVNGYRAIIKNLNNIDSNYITYEIGKGRSIKIRDFVNLIHQITRSNIQLRFGAAKNRNVEIKTAKANTREMKKIGWSALINEQEGVRRYLMNEFNFSTRLADSNK